MDTPTVIVVTDRVIRDLASGYDLRVYNLVRQLALEYRIVNVVVDLSGEPDDRGGAPLIEPAWVASFPRRRSAAALARTTERSYLRASAPSRFAALSAAIGRTFAEEGARSMVVFNAHIATLVPPALRDRTVVDICDSMSVILRRRASRVRGARPGLPLRLVRWRRLERWITSSFAVTLAASEVDARAASTPRRRALAVPNGVSLAAAVPPDDGAARELAFWGNLDFEPNRDAVLSFSRDVVLPGLLPRDVSFRVIGRGAGEDVLRLAAQSEQIRLEGFRADLPGSLGGVSAMVNYMALGSGIKNKVLEAFAWGIVVISTGRGVEAFEGIVDGEHYLRAETPQEFAAAIDRVLADPSLRERIRSRARDYLDGYSWPAVGDRLIEIVRGAGADAPPVAVGAGSGATG
ncbi:MAG: glycosyltransferase [Thermoleophilia bacterium]